MPEAPTPFPAGPRKPSLPSGIMSPLYTCGQEGGACVSPHSSETWDGDRVLPTGKRGKKRPSSQLLLPGEGTPAKVRVSPQPSGSRDFDCAAACASPQTSVSRDDDATCVSPRPSGSREAGLGPITQNYFNYNYNYFEIESTITITPPYCYTQLQLHHVHFNYS